jgi:hypothetical protein
MPDLFAAATITGPYGPHYLNRRAPCSMAYNAAGDATITVMLPDSSLVTINAPATSYSTRTFPGILSLSVTGGPVTIEIYTPDMVVDPKYLATTTATITGTVKTDVGQGTAPVSQIVLTEPLGTTYDARQIRALTGTDNPKPFGSANTPYNQDSTGNLLHVPTLPNSTTPIYTQATQYDANNYPIHTIGNITSNGTDTLAPSSYFYNGVGQAGNSGYINIPNPPATGRKYEVQMVGIIIQNNTLYDTSTSVQFTQALCYAIGPEYNIKVGHAQKYTTIINDNKVNYNGTVANDTAITAWTSLPQSLSPSIDVNGAPNSYTNIIYQSNNGPASGDTTIVNQPLLLQAGDFFQVNLIWTSGTPSTNFLAYLFLWGVNKVL